MQKNEIDIIFQKLINAYQAKNEKEVEAIAKIILDASPSHIGANAIFGMFYVEKKEYQNAISLLNASLAGDAKQFWVHDYLALSLINTNDVNTAIHHLNIATKLNPRYANAYFNLGIAYEKIGLFELAVENYNQCLKLEKNYTDALIGRGNVYLYKLSNFQKAIEDYTLYIEMQPKSFIGYLSLAKAYKISNRLLEALENFNIGIKLNDVNEDLYVGRAAVLSELKQYEKSLEDYNKLINLRSDNANFYVSRGVVLSELKKYTEALKDYEEALKINPQNDEAILNKGIVLLKFKKFDIGWEFLPSRLNIEEHKVLPLQFISKPLFILNKNKDKKTLILGEHGIGDQILYASMLKDFKKQCGAISLAVDKRLIDLFERSFPDIRVIDKNNLSDFHDYDQYILQLDLGNYCRNTLEKFPLHNPFLLADPNKSLKIKESLIRNSEPKKIICGVSWKSKNEKFGKSKSIPIEKLLPILKLEHITFVNLQYGDTQHEIDFICKEYGIKIHNIQEIDNTNDIDGLCSIINMCDFVITSSNVTAHISGGLGKETYILLPHSNGKIWYWHEDDNRSLWYPSCKLYSQLNHNDWTAPIEKILEEINNYAK
jgi:tetratricopeptide (TPR) repeat protein